MLCSGDYTKAALAVLERWEALKWMFPNSLTEQPFRGHQADVAVRA